MNGCRNWPLLDRDHADPGQFQNVQGFSPVPTTAGVELPRYGAPGIMVVHFGGFRFFPCFAYSRDSHCFSPS